MKYLTLNVGCGTDSWGEVRVDINRVRKDIYKNPKTTATIYADVKALPFRDKYFNETRCWHLLEHVKDPKIVLSELKRVTNGTINLRFPIWHLFNYLIETIRFFKLLFLTPYSLLRYHSSVGVTTQLIQIINWKKRYSDHKWYIKINGSQVITYFGIPKEYKLVIKTKKEKYLIES